MTDAKPSETQPQRLAAVPDWRAFYDEHWRFVYAVARRLGASIDPEDVVQEVFIVAHRRFAEFNHGSSLRTWLYGITFNVIRDQRRGARRRQRLAGALSWVGIRVAPPKAEVSVELRELERVLGKMKEHERDVLLLREVEELSAEEVAVILGIPAATVRSRHFSAKRRFAELVRKEGGKP